MLEVFNKERQKVAILENAFDVKEELKINAIDHLTFSLPHNDRKNDFCQPFFYVRYNNGQLYRILPQTYQRSETGSKTYECEHVIATLIDNIMFGYHVVGNKGYYTKQVINYILDRQLVKNWVLAECDFNRQFEYGWEQENLLAALFSVPKPFVEKYIWRYDTSVYPFRLSLKLLDENQNPQLYIRNRKNILSIKKTSDPKDICTRLYPLGYGEGVNQLGIKEINNGVPYIQSPKAYTDKYGIIERAWTDRRYEDQESLLAAANAMLANLQEPAIEYQISFAELGLSSFDTAEIGKITRIIDTENDIDFKTYITGITRYHDDIPSSSITIANRTTSISETVADLADRQRIEMTYSQGATQLYGQSLQANADASNGAVMNFYIPTEMRIINKIEAKIKLGSFRAYSKATEGGGGYYSSTESGGGMSETTDYGGSLSPTSDYNATESLTSGIDDYLYDQSKGHNHGIPPGVRLAVYNGYTVLEDGSRVLLDGDSYGWVKSGDHVHYIYIPSHRHVVSIPSHRHWMSIPPHRHGLELPSHTHQITPGIYFFGYPRNFSVYVDGTYRGFFNTTNTTIDLTPFLLGSNSKITRGTWHEVEIRPNDLAYISIDLMVQGFVQSRGDYTY